MERNELRNAAIGAVVTIALSFTGFSALLGGAVAGYLQREPPKRGARVGALSGGIAVLPVLMVLALGFVLLLGQPTALGIPGAMELLIVLLIFPLSIAWIVGLSAVGGYVGAYLRTDRRTSQGEPMAPKRG
jgi:hypothetical protein